MIIYIPERCTMPPSNYIFQNRIHAGKILGEKLLVRGFMNPVVLALPRGGVPVANEVARVLGAPLDVVIARKIGSPGHQEFAIGAMSEDCVPYFNKRTIHIYDIAGAEIKAIVNTESEEVHRRIKMYRGERPLPSMQDRPVIVVDDGLATGATAAAAGAFIRKFHPRELIFAAPVCPTLISGEVKEEFDEIVCAQSIRDFQAVGLWYQDFRQVEDKEVMEILNQHHVEIRGPWPQQNEEMKRFL
jgi:putative phosphoribosyl transferase